MTNDFPSGYGLDISNYKRIEILTGPGGALWGAHSLLGVINLISFSGADLRGAKATYSVGSFGYQSMGLKVGDVASGLDYFLSARVVMNRGQNRLIEGPTFQTVNWGPRYEQGSNGETSNRMSYFADFFGKLHFKDFSLMGRVPISKAYFPVSEEGGLLGYDNGYLRSDDWVFHLAYDKRFPQTGITLLVKAYLYRNITQHNNRLWTDNPHFPNGFGYLADYGLALKTGGVVEAGWRSSWFTGKIQNRLIGGGDLQRESVSSSWVSLADTSGVYLPGVPLVLQQTSVDTLGRATNADNTPVGVVFSGYLQDEISFFQRVSLAAGVRLNTSNTYDNTALWSGSAVVEVLNAHYLKMKIVEGMRPPTMLNRFGQPPLAAPKGEFLDPNAAIRPLRPSKSHSYQFEYNGNLIQNKHGIKNLKLRSDVSFIRN